MAAKSIPREDVERIIEQTVNRYQDHVDPGLGFMIQSTLGDIVEWEAEGARVTDLRGDTWYDAISFMGVFGLGHRHPKVVAAVKEQLDRMPMNARFFFNKPQSDLAAKLIEIAPNKSVKNVFFTNSGSEAVDVALKSACFTTKRTEIISMAESYHGVTLGSISVTGMAHFRNGIEGMLSPHVKFAEFGNIESLANIISDKTACVIAEPVHAGLGSKMAPKDYFKKLRELCDKTGALFIDDEVQTGLGRTGKLWGIEHYEGNVKPDFVLMGKVLSGGVIPCGACLYSQQVTDAISERVVFNTSTFGGGELACAAGLAAVEVILDENLSDACQKGGEVLGNALQKVAKRWPQYIKEIRGVGLMWTIEFSDWLAAFFVFPHIMREHKIIITPHLNRLEWLRISPALNARHEDLERVARCFDQSVAAFHELDPETRKNYEYAFAQSVAKSFDKSTLEASGVGGEK